MMLRGILPIRRVLRPKALQEDEGAALVELALVLLFFVPILFGVTAIGALMYDSIEVSEAAHAGAAYAVQSFRSSGAVPANVDTVTLAAEPNVPANMLVTPTVACGCGPNSGTPPTNLVCTTVKASTCSGANILYVTVKTQANVTPLLNLTSLGFPVKVQMNGAATFELAP